MNASRNSNRSAIGPAPDGEMFNKAIYKSPIGDLPIYSDGEFLVELDFPRSRFPLSGPQAPVQLCDCADDPVLKQTSEWLDRYFAGDEPDPHELPLRFIGTDFRKKVWTQLLEIPYGETVTYGDIARAIECRSAQAVGGAVGHNPIPVINPCHRVVGAGGNLTGFGGGMKTKIWLLEHEGFDMNKFTVPTKGTAL